jgi:hypothetical protein
MKTYDEIELEAIKKSRTKKPKMKVSGKSVFILSRVAGKQKKK